MTKLDKMYHTRKYIKEYMPIIKDVFKEYYGSIWNEKIDKSLDNFSFVGYLSANDMNNIINNIKCDISKELEIKYLNTFGFNVNNRHLFFFSPGFSKLKHSYIYKIMHRQKGYEKLLRFVFDLKEDDENYSQKFNDYLRKIDASKETLYKYKKIYDKKLKEYEEYIDIDERYQELRNNGKAKYIQNLIERIYEYLPEEDKKFYIKNKKHFLNDKSAADYFRKMKIFKVIIRTYDDSIDFSYPGYIDAFTEEKEKKLNDPITAEYTRNNIKRD